MTMCKLNAYFRLMRLDKPIGILLLLTAIYGSQAESRVGYPKEDLYV